ncbi:MAG: precorrin-2 C(20)-methyltransferase [Atopobiaceae bacterium]|jgi:precorrin-2/cobalt-factor-2 C20-methyltransferase
MNGSGTFFGVSVGPGDKDLLTLKAVKTLESAGCIAAPQSGGSRRMALDIVDEYIHDKKIIDVCTPMTHDESELARAHRQAAELIVDQLIQGKDVAMVVLGDIGIYSTFHAIATHVMAAGFEVEIIPGVTSFCAAAAKLKIPLCQGQQSLLITPACGGVDAALNLDANCVLMKPSHDISEIRECLSAHGLLDHASAVSDVGHPDERIYRSLKDAPATLGYFSLVIVDKTASRR